MLGKIKRVWLDEFNGTRFRKETPMDFFDILKKYGVFWGVPRGGADPNVDRPGASFWTSFLDPLSQIYKAVCGQTETCLDNEREGRLK